MPLQHAVAQKQGPENADRDGFEHPYATASEVVAYQGAGGIAPDQQEEEVRKLDYRFGEAGEVEDVGIEVGL